MKEKLSDELLKKTFDGINSGFAYCELLTDDKGRPKDYLFLIVNSLFEVQLNRNVGSTVGKTLKETSPAAEQSWIDIFGSVVIDQQPANFTHYDSATKRDYRVSAFSDEENRFVMVIDDITAKRISINELRSLESINETLTNELVVANQELKFEIDEDIKYTAELVVANEALLFENGLREKAAKALVIANKELEGQKREKVKRSIDLIGANTELEIQKKEKEKRVLELRILKSKSNQMNWLKADFLIKMSHKIRTPMNGIWGISQLLGSENITNIQQQDYVRIIESFGNSMLVELDSLVSLFKPNYMQFEEVIKENIYSNLSVRELALLCNMSLSSFKRKFAELYIITPIKYFKKLKLEKACELLKAGDVQISNIAIEVGIYSLTTFNRSFKSYYGKSPSQFRMDETSQ
jgi:AraC-like DNA-binding protein